MIEILIDLGIVSMVAMAVLSAFMYSFKVMSSSKARIAAVILANEKMEDIRNMSYVSVGLTDTNSAFIPSGNILAEEQVLRDGRNFDIKTIISFVDDPFDGCGTTENDTSINCRKSTNTNSKLTDNYEYDYKKVEVRISQIGKKNIILAELSSNLSSKTAETSLNTGQMNICIYDSQGVRIADATVVVSNSVLPSFGSKTYTTKEDDCVKIPNLVPVEDRSYHIAVSKTTDPKYNSDQTYPISTKYPNPVNPDVNISAQLVTTVNFTLEKNSTAIKMNLRDSDGNIITPSCVGEDDHSIVISNKNEWAQGNANNIELNNPSGDISIKDKNIIYDPIDLAYIYNQVTSRISSNVNKNTYNRPYVIDGDSSTFWQAEIVQNQKVHVPAYWKMDLGRSYDVTKIALNYAQDKFKVEWAPNNSNYESMWSQFDIDVDTISAGQNLINPISMRYIKITNTSDIPTTLDRIFELQLYQSIAAATHTTSLTQIDSGVNDDGTKKIRQWKSFKPSEEDSDSKNTDPPGRLDDTNIYYSFRYSDTGDKSDSAWTPWSQPVTYKGGDSGISTGVIALKTSSDYQKRFLQIRADFISTRAMVTPVIHDYTIIYTTCKSGSGPYEFSLPFIITSTRNISDPIYAADNKTILNAEVPKYSYSLDIKSLGDANSSIYTTISGSAVWGYYNIALNSSDSRTAGWSIVSTRQEQSVYKNPTTELDVDIYVSQDSSLPRIANIAPDSVSIEGNTTLLITGSNFNASDKISIRKSGSEIIGTNVQLIDETHIQADFDIRNAVADIWDVIITNSLGRSTIQFGGQYIGPSGPDTIISGLQIK